MKVKVRWTVGCESERNDEVVAFRNFSKEIMCVTQLQSALFAKMRSLELACFDVSVAGQTLRGFKAFKVSHFDRQFLKKTCQLRRVILVART